MGSGTRIIYKGFSSKFPVDYSDRHKPDKGRRVQWPKYRDNNNKDEENRLPVKNINKDNSSSHKFRQKFFSCVALFLRFISLLFPFCFSIYCNMNLTSPPLSLSLLLAAILFTYTQSFLLTFRNYIALDSFQFFFVLLFFSKLTINTPFVSNIFPH